MVENLYFSLSYSITIGELALIRVYENLKPKRKLYIYIYIERERERERATFMSWQRKQYELFILVKRKYSCTCLVL